MSALTSQDVRRLRWARRGLVVGVPTVLAIGAAILFIDNRVVALVIVIVVLGILSITGPRGGVTRLP